MFVAACAWSSVVPKRQREAKIRIFKESLCQNNSSHPLSFPLVFEESEAPWGREAYLDSFLASALFNHTRIVAQTGQNKMGIKSEVNLYLSDRGRFQFAVEDQEPRAILEMMGLESCNTGTIRFVADGENLPTKNPVPVLQVQAQDIAIDGLNLWIQFGGRQPDEWLGK
jgi:hypothetical protein